MAVIWYYTHYVLRELLKKKIIEACIRDDYKELGKSKQKRYLLVSIVIFILIFVPANEVTTVPTGVLKSVKKKN